jgi:hypothetical protein
VRRAAVFSNFKRLCTASNGSSAGHEIEDEYDDGQDEKDVYPAAQCVAADESYDPENEENNCNCPKHFALLDDAGLASRFVVIYAVQGPYRR